MSIVTGNAGEEDPRFRGWLVGHFRDPDELKHAEAVEVKWSLHPAGNARAAWSPGEAATTLALLVRGRFVLTFPEREALLAREGDYVLWGPGVPHRWHAEDASVVVTVRWRS